MLRLPQHSKNTQKSFSKPKSNQKIQFRNPKEHEKVKTGSKQEIKTNSKIPTLTKSKSKQNSNHKSSKDSKKQHNKANLQLQKNKANHNILIHSRKRLTASQDKLAKNDKFFKRTNKNDNRKSISKKGSKRSRDNQNQEIQIERLKAQNEQYKKAYLESKESLQKLEKYLEEQKKRRNHNKDWFNQQINNLKKKISSDKIQLGHIFTFDSFRHDQISNMIIQTENESSSLVVPTKMQQDILDALSDLSIESK